MRSEVNPGGGGWAATLEHSRAEDRAVDRCPVEHPFSDGAHVTGHLPAGHEGLHEDPNGEALVLTLPDFERYVEEHGITEAEAGAAFAAWLHEGTGWDGEMRQIRPPDEADEDGE
jgi:hypothetical protein